eukprot:8214022-Pyramimonas_sp.AAC.1
MVSGAGDILASAHFPLPHPLQDIYGAELYVVLMSLRHSGPDEILLGVDCQSLLDVWARGPHQNVMNTPFGEYWGEVLARVRDRGEGQTALFK